MSLVDRVKKKNLICSGDKVVLGVSGGPDSLCMLFVLAELREEVPFELFVAHINHQLRDVADVEEEYVKDISEKLNFRFFSEKVDVLNVCKVEKMSCEEAARKIRYDFFEKVLIETGANKIAVAHNANDRAETVLLNLIRGSGLDGLCGISAINGKIIRPMLEFTREEIESYLKERGIVAMIDKTNFDEVYTRNKVRNRLIPYLKEINPNVVATLNRTADILTETRDIVKDALRADYEMVKKDDGCFLLSEFLKLSESKKLEVLRMAICEFYGSNKDISYENLKNAVRILTTSNSGAVVEIIRNLKIKREYDFFYFVDGNDFTAPYCYELKIPGRTIVDEAKIVISVKVISIDEFLKMPQSKNIVAFDIAKVGKKVYVRSKRFGDFFYPTGMNGRKTLKKFFSDLKIAERERNKWPILATENEVIGVIGKRLSKKFLKDESTKEVIILDYGENI